MGSLCSCCSEDLDAALEITPLLQRREVPRRFGEEEEEEEKDQPLMIQPSPNFWIEGNKPACLVVGEAFSFWNKHHPPQSTYEEVPIVSTQYQKLFVGNPHIHIIGKSPELGRVCISCLVKVEQTKGSSSDLRRSSENGKAANIYTIVRWNKADNFILTPLSDVTSVLSLSSSLPILGSSLESILENQVVVGSSLGGTAVFKAIQRSCPDLSSLMVETVMSEQSPGWSDLESKLGNLESGLSLSRLKVGVLYCRENQISEKEIYGNGKPGLSKGFQQFLSLLGEKFVVPSDREEYTGGLHEGQEGLRCSWGGAEFVFHVAPMLAGDDSGQQIIRKKHIGNDTVVVIFVDSGHEISPEIFHSKVNMVFIFVRLSPANTYHVQVTAKESVDYFEPELETGLLFSFQPDQSFRNFLFQKIANGHFASYKSLPYQHYWHARQFQLGKVLENVLHS